jgi:NAD(P)-dependent dehydrogenase (short-subunit alcohol dehydrogenase family)
MPEGKHAGRVALVTGAARGIGQAIAVGLADQGAAVVVGDVSDLTETGELLDRAGSKAMAMKLDVSDPSAVEEARAQVATELGRCDILVNNAAILETVTWDELDHELWHRVMRVNLDGPMLMCKAFLTLMRGRGWGRVINIASGSIAVASPVSIAYRASKMGVIGLTRALSAPLAEDGITINAVCPSITRTAMAAELGEAVVAQGVARQAIGHLAEPADIAASVLMLASDEARWITGQTVMANGGGSFL